jgi:hypothetical protein
VPGHVARELRPDSIRNTVFSAAFAGDNRYASRAVTTSATLTPTVRTQMQWPLSTTRIGSPS